METDTKTLTAVAGSRAAAGSDSSNSGVFILPGTLPDDPDRYRLAIATLDDAVRCCGYLGQHLQRLATDCTDPARLKLLRDACMILEMARSVLREHRPTVPDGFPKAPYTWIDGVPYTWSELAARCPNAGGER